MPSPRRLGTTLRAWLGGVVTTSLVVSISLIVGQHRGGRAAESAAKGHTAAVLAVAFAPDGKTLASAGADGMAKLWDLVTSRVRADLAGHEGRVGCIAFAPGGNI